MSLVAKTSEQLSRHYKAQASGRDINLFYLVDGVRERIVKNEEGFWVTHFRWSEAEILKEVEDYPERFSANVILRGVFQETILPNVAFIGGGGEVAYWLQLKDVFEAVKVPYPVLVLRNSFLIHTAEQRKKIEALGFSVQDFFKSKEDLLAEIVLKNTERQVNLDKEKQQLLEYYTSLNSIATAVDASLSDHVQALQKRALKKIEQLEKKMFRAEKKKFEAQERQINALKLQLFPNNSLQERVDNIAPFYAQHGPDLLDELCAASQTLEQQFALLEIDEQAGFN